MSSWLRSLCVALCVCVAAGITTPRMAAAQKKSDREEARRHFQRGEKLYALGRFEEALVQYELAFETEALPEFLFNIGQCHRNLKNYERAIFSFKKYLRLKPGARNRTAVEALIVELEEEQEMERQRRLDKEQDRRVDLVPKPDEPDPRPEPPRPIYTKWWFWTGIAVVGAGVAGALYLSSDSGGDGIPASDLGNLDFPR